MSAFTTPSASRAARQLAVTRGIVMTKNSQAFIDPHYEQKKARRKMARASRRRNR
jgi:hypothetical protein